MENMNIFKWIISGAFSVVSLLGIFLSLPMWQGKIPPNRISGFRTAQTLSNPELWYSVNTAVGRTLVFVNIALLIATIVTHFTISRSRPIVTAMVLTAFMLIGTIFATIQGYLMIRGSH